MQHSASFAPASTAHGAAAPEALTPGVRAALIAVRAYQLLLAPFAGGACRFTPTCSAYALEAITAHGVWRGAWLALTRVAKCHPLGSSGIDPVPPSSR